jgi:hypothetical protein
MTKIAERCELQTAQLNDCSNCQVEQDHSTARTNRSPIAYTFCICSTAVAYRLMNLRLH